MNLPNFQSAERIETLKLLLQAQDEHAALTKKVTSSDPQVRPSHASIDPRHDAEKTPM